MSAVRDEANRDVGGGTTADVHARITREGLPVALRGLAVIYLVHTVYHAFGPGGQPVLALGALATTILFATVGEWLARRPPERRVHLVACAAALVVLGNIAVHYAVEPLPGTTVHFVLLLVAAGAALLDPWSLGITLTSTIATWVILTLLRGSGTLYAPEGLHIVVATVLAIVLRLAHGRTVAAVLRAETRQREAEKLEAIGRLAGGVAHDFNNLLTIIRINARYALTAAARHDDAATRADLHDIMTATDRAAHLTQELLAFGRRQVLSPQVIDLGSAVDELAHTLERLVGERIELRVRRAAGVAARVHVDPQLVERALLNLAANARDAMPDGGSLTLELDTTELSAGPRRGELQALAPGRYVTLRVTDTGTGMDPATLARVFEPFFTTKGQGGTGLGLATVYGAVRQSGGAVTVTSVLGRGTCFEIWLPSAAPLPSSSAGAAASVPARNTA